MSDFTLPHTYAFCGRTVRYLATGEGPPLVLLHGTPFSSYVWRRFVPLFRCRRRVYLFDLLGYGQSEKAFDGDVSLGIQNKLFSELLDHWNLERPDVIGHDFGGTTALRAHLLDGKDYRSLTLVDPVAMGPVGSAFVQSTRPHKEAFQGLPSYIHEAIVARYIRGTMWRPGSDALTSPYQQPWLDADGQWAFYEQIAQMDQAYTDEIEPYYGNVRCPTLILWGEEDAWIPLDKGKRLHRLIPNSQFVPIPNAGHLVQEDAPEAIVAAVLPFLDNPDDSNKGRVRSA